jgi:hypothetical protein
MAGRRPAVEEGGHGRPEAGRRGSLDGPVSCPLVSCAVLLWTGGRSRSLVTPTRQRNS